MPPALRASAVFVAGVVAIALATPAVADPGDPIPGNGVFRVGPDIAPGVYQTAGPSGPYVRILGQVTPESMCTWFTYRTPDANKDHVISTSTSLGPTYVNIPATVGAFETMYCRPWTRVP